MIRRTIAVGTILVAAAIGGVALFPRSTVIEVEPGQDLHAAMAAARDGTVVRLGRGTHVGPVEVIRSITLEGEPGAIIAVGSDHRSAITVLADRAVVKGLRIDGGFSGVTVEGAEGVRLEELSIRRADLHGIEVVEATAEIRAADIAHLVSDYAQGIEIRNSDGLGRTIVADSVVNGGQEGIVSHVSEVVFENNVVSHTTLRGIAITEMSDGVARGNTVSNGIGTGLFCGDMSRCAFYRNRVSGITAGSGRFSAGWGLSVAYHATASSEGDVLSGAAGATQTFIGSRIVARSPLELGMGASAIIPTSAASAAALALLAAAYILVRRSPRPPETTSRGSRLLPGLGLVVLAALIVQSFHMFEHGLQVYRVHFDGVPSRGGLAGPRAEPEWVHFVYNSAIIVLFVGIIAARGRGWLSHVQTHVGDRLLASATLIQGYHVVEHAAKLTQHIITGKRVNPGLVGAHLDLVWMHFTINLAVYIGFLAAIGLYAYGFIRARRPAGAREPLAAGST